MSATNVKSVLAIYLYASESSHFALLEMVLVIILAFEIDGFC